jgi:hypothetical protein
MVKSIHANVCDRLTDRTKTMSFPEGGDTATPVAHLQLLNAKTTAGTYKSFCF